MTPPDLLHPAWLGPTLALWAATALATAGALALAVRRRRRLLGPVRGGRPASAGDALRLAALGALLLGLLGPRWGTETVRVPASGSDVAILVDVSRSMDARDVPPSRLARARELADRVLAGLGGGDRAALAVFAGRGVLLTPLTPDKEALRALLPALDSSLMEDGGSHLEAGVEAALGAFHASSLRPRTLLVLSDGEDPEHPDGAGTGAERAAAAAVRVVAVAYGTSAGAPVPSQTGALRDGMGREVRTRAQPARLEALARATHGARLAGDAFGAVDPAAVLRELLRGGRRADGFLEREMPVQRSDLLACLALALLLADALRRAGARRRGAGAALAAALALPLLVGGARGDTEPSGTELLRTGVQRAESGDLARAERAFFAAAARADDPEVAAAAYYDLGVAALARGDAPAARDALLDALALRPGDRHAQFNLEWAQRLLASPPPPGSGRRDEDARTRPEGEAQTPSPEPERQEERAAAAPTDAGAEASPARRPLRLDPDQARSWLERVSDDPRGAMRAAAKGGETGATRHLRPGPRW